MLSREPVIRVGIYEHEREAAVEFRGEFSGPEGKTCSGVWRARVESGQLLLTGPAGEKLSCGAEAAFTGLPGATFVLRGVTIGINFHWERKEDETFQGNLRLLGRQDGTVTAINEISVEGYLKSVISSEMSAEAPVELLRAHAITSRSWLVAMLERENKNVGVPSQRSFETESETIRWYDREDHQQFDVCADDHCQRYQGISKIISRAADNAVESTRGVFLVHDGRVCDARFYKACGGLTEQFENAWEDTPVPYLRSVSDAETAHPPIASERQAADWLHASPEAYCNTNDADILRQILPSFDRETTDFFRWKVEYTREQLEDLLWKKSGIRFGTLKDLVPVRRGPSGRIWKLRVEGSKRTLVVGKELEIRRWLSESHLYSSAFVVENVRDGSGIPTTFILHGGGWGHGVGLCQIGAAVMASRGTSADRIVKHYFPGAELLKLY